MFLIPCACDSEPANPVVHEGGQQITLPKLQVDKPFDLWKEGVKIGRVRHQWCMGFDLVRQMLEDIVGELKLSGNYSIVLLVRL